MYKCEDCGASFDEYAVQTGWEDRGFAGNGQAFENVETRKCPHCGSEYFSKAYVCKDCGGVFFEDEISLPLCVCSDCLKEHITLENFLEYAMESEPGICDYKTYETIEDFMLVKIFGFPSTSFFGSSTLEFKRFLAQTYSNMAMDKNVSERLLQLVKEYVTTGTTECIESFAEYLYWKEFINGKKQAVS